LFIQFLVEGRSDKQLLEIIMMKYRSETHSVLIECDIKDYNGLGAAYPDIRDRIATKLSQYTQDEIRIEGTWEFLADMLTKKGAGKGNPTKIEWAKSIGAHLTIRGNASPSFNRFIGELDKRASYS